MDTTDQPNSICHVQPIQFYPLSQVDSKKNLPFSLMPGEMELHSGTSVDGLIMITNYKLFLQIGNNQHHIPLGLIEVVEHRDLFYLQIGCKDARTYRITFENNESCLEWYDHIQKTAEPPKQLDQLFAFYYYVWTKEKDPTSRCVEKDDSFDEKMFWEEMHRMEFEGHSWRISKVNENYKLCPSYPPYLLVPSCINDTILESVAKFRSSRRIPAAVWRHTRNGAVIARCSQPEVGWLGWRSSEDEDLIKAISEACNFDRSWRNGSSGSNNSDRESNLSHSPGSLHSEECLQINTPASQQDKKVLIMDARSYTTAVANRARGGGCECPEYYPNCEIQFMNLANIHSIRKSFHALRQLCTSSADQPNWFSQLEGTRWLLHMSVLMKAAVTVVTAVERDARPVLVHCSDGWDRTPQIVALAELLLDPYYRTIDGFRILIEREWLAFGHKFADRCGHSTGSDDQNERCPVFLQWLDCVHQLLLQFPCDFEFTQMYLVKLAQHTYSNLFGTFLCNTQQERAKNIYGKTFSVWEFLNAPCFRNHLYAPLGNSRKVLWPQCNVRDLSLWSEIYLGTMEPNFSSENGAGSCPGPPEQSPHHMTKTRSFGDLINAGEVCPNMLRRNSDPNINNSDKKLNDLAAALPQDTNKTQDTPSTNGHHENSADDIDDCNIDCIFKKIKKQVLTDDQIDGLDHDLDYKRNSNSDLNSHCHHQLHANEENVLLPPFVDQKLNNGDAVVVGGTVVNCRSNNVIQSNGDKTDENDCDELGVDDNAKQSICLEKDNDECNNDLLDSRFCKRLVVNGCAAASAAVGDNSIGNSSHIVHQQQQQNGDVNHNSSSSCNGSSDLDDIAADCVSQLENASLCDLQNSVETSTDTLVSENLICSSSPKELNGFEKVQSPVDYSDTDGCKTCKTQNSKSVHSCDTSRNSTPLYFQSQTSSSNGWDNTLHNYSSQKASYSYQYPLGEDGLIPLKSVVQERLDQILEDHKKKVDVLQKQIQTKPTCHKCNHNENDKQDDNSSVIESVCSAGEGQTSAVDSSCSDMSWEALDVTEPSTGARWVPDHAVNRCIRCNKGFWFGKRKHHCRKCGNIFCADCSKNSTPLPSEQLYEPVRVCSWCYAELIKDCGDLSNQCKQNQNSQTNNNPQITASSN